MPYTKAEKEKLIQHIKSHAEKRLQAMVNESDKIAEICENKVLRRLNSVSVTLWNIRLKDVLEVERHHKPTIKGLLKDVRQLQENSLSNSSSSTNISYNIRNSSRIKSNGKISKPRS
mmetsp:Transcript_4594/g.5503  ORF Transcript_4594/g.5503 Transcript_4594/m.5503 type:complete len:117 (-) Transcript_4594:4482-4832(-)